MNPQRSAFSAPPAHFLAEWYQAGLTEEHLDRIAAQLTDSAASAAPPDLSTRLLTMLAVPSDEVVFGVFAADSAQAVVNACLRAGLPVDRLTPAAVRVAGDRIDGPLRGR
ncbi:MAG TPA: hypothetical protein VFE65_13480 [Pseudonocardia sp.]|jgi:hypothetical protein|nr:hypothetical protein [Pseudonocardia sp.]